MPDKTTPPPPEREDRDSKGNPIERVPGPGPKDTDAGARGPDAKERDEERR
jgi:hypothetical protein